MPAAPATAAGTGRAEVRDQARIDAVGLAADQTGPAEGLDLGRIDHADRVPGVGQKLGYRFPVGAGGLKAGVDRIDTVRHQPLSQYTEPGRRVLDHLAAPRAVRAAQYLRCVLSGPGMCTAFGLAADNARAGKGRQAVPTDPIGRSSRLRNDVRPLCGLAMFRYIQLCVGTLRFAHPMARSDARRDR